MSGEQGNTAIRIYYEKRVTNKYEDVAQDSMTIVRIHGYVSEMEFEYYINLDRGG
jgi:hypothetical protein